MLINCRNGVTFETSPRSFHFSAESHSLSLSLSLFGRYLVLPDLGKGRLFMPDRRKSRWQKDSTESDRPSPNHIDLVDIDSSVPFLPDSIVLRHTSHSEHDRTLLSTHLDVYRPSTNFNSSSFCFASSHSRRRHFGRSLSLSSSEGRDSSPGEVYIRHWFKGRSLRRRMVRERSS